MRKFFNLLVLLFVIFLTSLGFAQLCNTDVDCTPRGPGFECNTNNQCEWQPPIGIPAPDFGIEETHYMYQLGDGEDCTTNPEKCYDFGNGLEPYKDAGNGPYTHYVDNSGDCDDGSDGTVDNPRCEIPRNLEAGSVVEVHGGHLDHPVFLRGVNKNYMPIISIPLRFAGSHLILEYLDIDGGNINLHENQAQDFIAIRYSELHNHTRHAILMDGSRDIVIYNNYIHHYGDWQLPYESDIHGAEIASADRVWMVDNHISYMQGDGIQTYGGNPRYLYIGRNEINNNRENAIDIKVGENIIISENSMHDYIRSTGAVRLNDEGILDNIWVIYNDIYKNMYGINTYGTTFPAYIIGNKIHDFDGPAIRGGGAGPIVNNVIYNVERGIEEENSQIINNIISQVSNFHIENNVDLRNNLLWQNGNPVTIHGTASCIDCIEADPLFIDPDNNNFKLSESSPAIDTGIESDVYAEFESLYRIDIRVDFDGNPRPQGTGWDIGAFEADETVSCVSTEQLLEYIDQWNQGSVSMPYLINRIATWKTGC